jgi:hypothetical protein
MYEDTYGTDWDSLDRDAAMGRAFALGVDASLGNRHPEEYDRIVEEMDTAYNRSIVELAYEEGKNKAKKKQYSGDDSGGDEAVWADLVEGEKVTVDEDDVPTGSGRNSLPSALDKTKLLDRPDTDSRGRVEKPDFLERD